jgi:hypothetical protein
MDSSVTDFSREKIVQFSLVVKDAEKTASRFSEIFGTCWRLYALRMDDLILYGEKLIDAPCEVRIAIGDFAGRSLKLIQPVSGRSSYSEFLEKSGEGFYTIGFGTLLNHNQAVDNLVKAGIALEMQGDAGHGSRFSIMNTLDDLGCRIEFSSPAGKPAATNIRKTGVVLPENPSFVEMEIPVFAGGKKINQVGLVVRDEKRAAARFEELLGIGGWAYAYGPPNLVDAYLDERPVPESAMESLDVAFSMGWLGDLQIEIIRPIGIRPGGCHQRFLDMKGGGIQHVSFGIQGDYRSFVEGMKKAGIGAEFSATIKDHGVTACYFATQSQLGGFQLEIVGMVSGTDDAKA